MLLIITLERESIVLNCKKDRARVRLEKIDVHKEKEKLRKRIKQGTSTLTKEMRDTLRSRLCHQRTNGGWEEVQQKIIVTY